MTEAKLYQGSLVKILNIIFIALLAEGCAREKSFDVEPLATGGYVIRATALSWSEAAGTARERVLRDVEKYCRINGRDFKIKEIKIRSNTSGIVEIAEAEFDCVSLSSRAPR